MLPIFNAKIGNLTPATLRRGCKTAPVPPAPNEGAPLPRALGQGGMKTGLTILLEGRD